MRTLFFLYLFVFGCTTTQQATHLTAPHEFASVKESLPECNTLLPGIVGANAKLIGKQASGSALTLYVLSESGKPYLLHLLGADFDWRTVDFNGMNYVGPCVLGKLVSHLYWSDGPPLPRADNSPPT